MSSLTISRVALGFSCATLALVTLTSTARAANAPSNEGAARFWVGPAIELDTALLPGGDVCGRESQSAARYACFRADEEQYVGVPDPSGAVSPTLAYSTTRILLHAERPIASGFSVGGRLGFAFGGGPSPANGPAFMPLHAEVRLAYWSLGGLGSDRRFSLFALVLAGAGQFDAKRSIAIQECRDGTQGCNPAQNAQSGGPNPDHQKLDAYVKLGQGFAGLGLGAAYRFFDNSTAIADVRFTETFPTNGTALSLSLSYVFRGP